MINNLHIKNIGIINDIRIDFTGGLNIITGETGSGKTLIIESIQILLGEKFSKELIRSGENMALVEADIYLSDENKTIKASRSIAKNGKSVCTINGKSYKINDYKEIMRKIIDIHAQNDNQSLLDVNTHIELLDGYANNDFQLLKQDYSKDYEEYLYINSELSKSYGDDKEKQRMLDLLNYQVTEIENARLQDGEEEELEKRRDLIQASEKISNNLLEAESIINDSVIDGLSTIIHNMERIENYDEKYVKLAEIIKSAYYDLEEAGNDISSYSRELEFDEKEQNDIELRLDLIKSLKRKYGNSINEIIDYKEKIEKEIYDIENLEGYVKELKERKNILVQSMYDKARELNSIRVKMSKELSTMINNELKDLEMENAKFIISVELLDDSRFNKNGLDKVEFKISTNIGEEEKPLVKIASGGEMSRIMLAIKSVFGEIDKIPVIVFDEIDTGISGHAANSTGDKMKIISKTHQVICVTHLAPIAARGDANFYVSKFVNDGKTNTMVEKLDEEGVVNELARISSGNITKVAINHAKELRKMKCA